jgi:hypothetical protein
MSWVLYLRLFDAVAICLAIGVLCAIGVVYLGGIPARLRWLGASYVLFALTSLVEIELAIADHRDFSWRTVLVTTAAVVGLSSTTYAFTTWTNVPPLRDWLGDPSRVAYLAVVVAAAFGIAVLSVGLSDVNGKTNDLARNNHNVSCAQKAFYRESVKTTRKFLDSPQGREPFPIKGISRATFVRSYNIQKALLHTYDAVRC